jgi:hypothetical protein
MSTNNSLPMQWQFVEIIDGKVAQWVWRRVLIDGEMVAVSEIFDDFGKAIHNALRSGFRPNDEPWVTITMHGITYFHPVDGATPVKPGSREAALAYAVHEQSPRFRKRGLPKPRAKQSQMSTSPSRRSKKNGPAKARASR